MQKLGFDGKRAEVADVAMDRAGVHEGWAKVPKVSRSASMAARFRRLHDGDVRGLSPKHEYLFMRRGA